MVNLLYLDGLVRENYYVDEAAGLGNDTTDLIRSQKNKEILRKHFHQEKILGHYEVMKGTPVDTKVVILMMDVTWASQRRNLLKLGMHRLTPVSAVNVGFSKGVSPNALKCSNV